MLQNLNLGLSLFLNTLLLEKMIKLFLKECNRN